MGASKASVLYIYIYILENFSIKIIKVCKSVHYPVL